MTASSSTAARLPSVLLDITENSERLEKDKGPDDGKARRLANLKPFRKGTSGNPGGRPPLSAQVRIQAKEATPIAMERLIALMDSDDPRIVLMACKEILDRAYGKVGQAGKEDERDQQVTIKLVQFGEELRDANARLRGFGSNCE